MRPPIVESARRASARVDIPQLSTSRITPIVIAPPAQYHPAKISN